MPLPREFVTLLNPSTVTANGGGANGLVIMDTVRALRLYLDITAVSGTSPTIMVRIQDSSVDPGPGSWVNLADFGSQNAVGIYGLGISAPFGRRIRVSWEVGGTNPSFNITVRGWLIHSELAWLD